MNEALQRVIKEKEEMEFKINSLSKFINSDNFSKLNHYQKFLIKKQLFNMNEYFWTLSERINAWSDYDKKTIKAILPEPLESSEIDFEEVEKILFGDDQDQ